MNTSMRKEYDFSTMKGRKNPYLKQLKKQVTLRLGTDVIEYFKGMSAETGIPYQNLINMYLSDCTHTRRKLTINWVTSEHKQAHQETYDRGVSDSSAPLKSS